MTLSLCLFIFTYHGHKYTTLQTKKDPADPCWDCGATDFLLICVDFLLLRLTFWHVTMTTRKLYCILITYSPISLVWLLQSALSMKCVCVSVVSDTSASCDLLAISPRRARRRRRRRQKNQRRRRRRRKRFFLFGWRSIIHSHPFPPMLWMWLDAGTFAQPSIWLYWKWEASIRVSHSFSPGFRKPLAPLMDEKSDVCNVGDSAVGWSYTRA